MSLCVLVPEVRVVMHSACGQRHGSEREHSCLQDTLTRGVIPWPQKCCGRQGCAEIGEGCTKPHTSAQPDLEVSGAPRKLQLLPAANSMTCIFTAIYHRCSIFRFLEMASSACIICARLSSLCMRQMSVEISLLMKQSDHLKQHALHAQT